MNDIRQFDNITHTVADDLKVQLGKGGKVGVAAACFSIYAFEALKSELEGIDEFRFIFTSPAFTKEFSTKQKREFFIPKLQRERTLYGSDFELKLRNKMSQRAIARECAEWIKQKARFKTNVSGGSVNGFLTCNNPEDKYVYMPFNEFTTTELGLERGNNLCPTAIRLSSPMADNYIRDFNELWNDERQFKDVTEQIAADEEQAKLKMQIEELERKCRAEKQPRKRLELYNRLQELKKKTI